MTNNSDLEDHTIGPTLNVKLAANVGLNVQIIKVVWTSKNVAPGSV